MHPGRRDALILGAAGLAAAAAGFLLGPVLLRSTGAGDAGWSAGEGNLALRSASLVDLAGRPRKLGEWQGRVLVCNFWATWCAPCREEIPLLIAARRNYASLGVEIVGIAIDNATKVREFSSSFAISYPVLLAEGEGLDLMRQLGNSSGGLPFTVVFDRHGTPVRRKLGALKRGELDGILEPIARG